MSSEVSGGDRVRLLHPVPAYGVEAGEEGYASTDYGVGDWREAPLWYVWIYRFQKYVPVSHDNLELVAKYIPGKPARTPNGDYVYLDPGVFVNPDGTRYVGHP